MSAGKFPIANLLKSGAPIRSLDGHGLDMVNQDNVRTHLLGDLVAFFELSVAADLYWLGKQDYYRLDSDFGPMRPPYPAMWCEWEVPDKVLIHGKWWDMEARARFGALVISDTINTADLDEEQLRGSITGFAQMYPKYFKRNPETNLDDMIRDADAFKALRDELRADAREMIAVQVIMYILDANDGVVFLPYARQIGLNPDGLFNHFISDMVPTSQVPEETLHAAKEIGDANPVWLALNLINCRNVTTREQGSVFARSTREKRQRVPITRYHTIELPGTAGRELRHGRRRRSPAEEYVMSQHRVRGHFKTFTAEAPLLGKHVGTYWWGWQVRGSKDAGEVISDYEIGA